MLLCLLNKWHSLELWKRINGLSSRESSSSVDIFANSRSFSTPSFSKAVATISTRPVCWNSAAHACKWALWDKVCKAAFKYWFCHKWINSKKIFPPSLFLQLSIFALAVFASLYSSHISKTCRAWQCIHFHGRNGKAHNIELPTSSQLHWNWLWHWVANKFCEHLNSFSKFFYIVAALSSCCPMSFSGIARIWVATMTIKWFFFLDYFIAILVAIPSLAYLKLCQKTSEAIYSFIHAMMWDQAKKDKAMWKKSTVSNFFGIIFGLSAMQPRQQ